jgi:CBS domain-containing protein
VAKLVADAMTAEVSSVDASAPVIEAARLMRSEDVGSVPIVDAGGHVTGIVTDRDIAVRLVAEGKEPTATGVSEVASGLLVTVTPEQELDEALNLMAGVEAQRVRQSAPEGRVPLRLPSAASGRVVVAGSL